MIDKIKAINLVHEWQALSKKKFTDAESETDDMGKRLIEHGATCYFNCAKQLLHLIEAGDNDVQKPIFFDPGFGK